MRPPNLTSILLAYFLIYVVWGSTYFFIGVALIGSLLAYSAYVWLLKVRPAAEAVAYIVGRDVDWQET